MNRSPRLYRFACWVLVFLPVLLYVIAPPDLPQPGKGYRGGDLAAVWNTLSQLAGIIALTSLALSFVLSSRFKPLERRLGGLDKMYRLHHRMGLTAFASILLHPLLFALRFLPNRWDKFLDFWGPFHRDLSVNIGVIVFWLFIVLIVLTLVRRFPYHWWKQTHRLMGLVLVGAGWHMLTVPETPGRTVAHLSNPYLYVYLVLMLAVGIAAYLYKWFWVPLFRERYRYRVDDVQRKPPSFINVRLSPLGEPIHYTPGQFAFARFEQQNMSNEQHPFTLCSPPDSEVTHLTIKVLGDFTRSLYEQLEEGAKVRLEGPYGQFSYRNGKKRQVWLAGGIGVTPFVCWLQEIYRNMEQEYEIDFYYCVHDREESLYHREMRQWAAGLPGVNFNLVCTGEEGHITADQIPMDDQEWPEVYMCGPIRFIRDLESQLRTRGLPAELIHHEEFQFR